MSYTYTSFSTALAAALTVPVTDTDFIALLPSIIDEAEQRLYRELDLVSTSIAVGGTMTANNRYFDLPTSAGHIIVIDAINVMSATNVRHPMKPSTRDVIDYFWPSDAATSTSDIPQLFARISDSTVIVGPSPGTSWTAEVVGTVRPTPLSNSNTITFLSTYLSDLFFAAAMCSGNAVLLKNYGAESENPQQAVSWETKYQTLFASAKSEELRKLFISANSPLPASVKA